MKRAAAPEMETSVTQPQPTARQGSGSASKPSGTGLSAVAKAKRRRNNPEDACLTCRLRKVKCTGRVGDGPCTNCARLKLSCAFVQHVNGQADQGDKVARITPNGVVTEAGTLRKRAQRACSNCHLHKTKCSGDLPRCQRCQANDLPCEYVPAKRKFANIAMTPTPTEDQSTPQYVSSENEELEAIKDDIGLSPKDVVLDPVSAPQINLIKREVVLKHMDAYFQHYFHMPCMGVLHEPTIYRMIEDNTLSPVLASAVCAITASLVSTVSVGKELAEKCNETVEWFLFRKQGDMEADLLPFYVLDLIYNWMSKPWGKVWMTVANAARLIRCLQLNYEPEVPSDRDSVAPVEQEIRRRSVWQIYIIDHFLGSGYDEYILLPSSSMHLRLPSMDSAFRDGLASTVKLVDGNPFVTTTSTEQSFAACHIKILTIRSHILSASKKFPSAPKTHHVKALRPEQVMDIINQHQTSLNRFNEFLPDHMKLSEQNVEAYLYARERSNYIMLHTWVCLTHMDLYRFALPDFNDGSISDFLRSIPYEFLHRCQSQVVAYACSLAQFWMYCVEIIGARARSAVSKGLVTIDWMIGAGAVDVATVLLTARKYPSLYRKLRDGSSAQLCKSKEVDDDMLASMVSGLIKVLELVKPFVPRIDSYQQQLIRMIEKFDEEKAAGSVANPGAPTPLGGNALFVGTNTGIGLPMVPQHVMENPLMMPFSPAPVVSHPPPYPGSQGLPPATEQGLLDASAGVSDPYARSPFLLASMAGFSANHPQHSTAVDFKGGPDMLFPSPPETVSPETGVPFYPWGTTTSFRGDGSQTVWAQQQPTAPGAM